MKNASGESKKSNTKRTTNTIQVVAVRLFLKRGGRCEKQYGQVKSGVSRFVAGSLAVPHRAQKRAEYSIGWPQPVQ
jgi:hypothetical protein